MSFFEQFKDSQKVLSLERPCLYSGKEILEHSKLILHNLITEREKNGFISEEDERTIQWLGRLENVIKLHYTYLLSIDEAVKIGLIP